MMRFFFIMIIAVAVAAQGNRQPSRLKINRCDAIPLGKTSFQDLIRFSPFIMYRSTVGAYNCSSLSFVGPAGTDTSYTGTAIDINKGSTLTYDLSLINDSIFFSHQCSDGTPAAYRVLFSNLKNRERSSFCVFFCDKQGLYVQMLACAGRTSQDEAYISNYLAKNLRVPVASPVYRSQHKCTKSTSCAAFS